MCENHRYLRRSRASIGYGNCGLARAVSLVLPLLPHSCHASPFFIAETFARRRSGERDVRRLGTAAGLSFFMDPRRATIEEFAAERHMHVEANARVLQHG